MRSRRSSYLSSWIQHSKTRVRAKTHEGYEGLVRLYARPGIGDIPLASLSPLHLQRLYGNLLSDPSRHLSGGTVLNLHLVLTQALSQAVRWGYISSNPAAGAQPPRPRRAELSSMDEAATKRLLAATEGTRLECPVAIAMAALPPGFGLYTATDVEYLLVTAFTGFRAAVVESQQMSGAVGAAKAVVHSGFWGCGAFGGNRVLLTTLQALAAEMAGVEQIVLHTGSDGEAIPGLARDLLEHGLDTEDVLPTPDLIQRLVAEGFEWGQGDGN